MLALMDAEDAPIWVQNNQGNIGIPTNSNTLFHHGLTRAERCATER